MSLDEKFKKSLSSIDFDRLKPVKRGDDVYVLAGDLQIAITGNQYDAEAAAKYLEAVSPEYIRGLVEEISRLKKVIESRGYNDDIWNNIVKLHIREGKGD